MQRAAGYPDGAAWWHDPQPTFHLATERAALHEHDLAFAGAIPENAIPPGTTPADAAQVFFEAWDDTRSLYKTGVLSRQYFIGALSLSARIDRSTRMAQELLRMHREAFRVYWA
jgi:hypothetical protein